MTLNCPVCGESRYWNGTTCYPCNRKSQAITEPLPNWAAEEIRSAWRAAGAAGGQNEAYRILERMVDRLGYGRRENNPPLTGI